MVNLDMDMYNIYKKFKQFANLLEEKEFSNIKPIVIKIAINDPNQKNPKTMKLEKKLLDKISDISAIVAKNDKII